ncbi:MAG: hypothetical protein ACREFQ_02250 [Stellaceae bacterium]
MSTLAETISESLARLGPQTQDGLRDIFAELGGLNLGEEDRLSVLATALAAVATIHHARHKPIYLEAVRTWALEISVQLAPPPVRLARRAGDGPIEDAADIIVSGLEGLLDGLTPEGAIGMQDRLVLELALFAQLLGRHEANAVHLTLRAVAEALGGEAYCAGRAVRVPLEKMALPLTRDACLASVPPRGVA